MKLIEEAITEWFGERCPDTQQGCACCDAWAEYDAIKGLVAALENRLHDIDCPCNACAPMLAALAAAKAVQHD